MKKLTYSLICPTCFNSRSYRTYQRSRCRDTLYPNYFCQSIIRDKSNFFDFQKAHHQILLFFIICNSIHFDMIYDCRKHTAFLINFFNLSKAKREETRKPNKKTCNFLRKSKWKIPKARVQ